MKKRKRIYIVCVIVLSIVLIMIGVGSYKYYQWVVYDNSQKVQFEDDLMGDVITYAAIYHDYHREGIYYPQETRENFREETLRLYHLERIEELSITYATIYTTLVAIEKCKNLEMLGMGASYEHGPSYPGFDDMELPEPASIEKMKQMQSELASILQECDKIWALYIWDDEGICKFTSLEFLKSGDGLKLLSLSSLRDVDYAPVWECSELRSLTLWGCDIDSVEGISQLQNLESLDLEWTNIVEAGDILNLPKLEHLEITGTPLAENEEELALIYEAFPDIDLEK